MQYTAFNSHAARFSDSLCKVFSEFLQLAGEIQSAFRPNDSRNRKPITNTSMCSEGMVLTCGPMCSDKGTKYTPSLESHLERYQRIYAKANLTYQVFLSGRGERGAAINGPRVERHSQIIQRSSIAPRSRFVIDISSYGVIAKTYAALEVLEAEEPKRKDTLRSILRWFDPVDTVSDFVWITDNPKKQACHSVRSNVDFSRWLLPLTASSPLVGPSLFWINAKAGAGKTYVSARLIEDMEGSQLLAYFFCDVNDERKRSFLDMLRTLTWQLLRQKPDQLNTLTDAYDSGEQLSARLLNNALRQLIRSGAACRLVIDILDECREDIRKSVLRLCELLRPEDKILIANHPENDIHKEIRKLRKEFAMVPIREEDNSRDIRAYLQEKIRDLNFRDIEDPDLNVQRFGH